MQQVHYSNFKETLIARGVLSAEQATTAVAEAEAAQLPLERHLLKTGLLTAEQLTLSAAAYFNMLPIALPVNFPISENFFGFADLDFWKRVHALPLMRVSDLLTVVFADPFDLFAQEEVATITQLRILPLAATEPNMKALFTRLKEQSAAANPLLAMDNVMKVSTEDLDFASKSTTHNNSLETLDEALESGESAPVIRMVNIMMLEALRTGASDIHFEAMEKSSRLRYRIDGELTERPAPPKALHDAVVSRIKIMADLDIAERRVPQDGRFKIRALNKEVDIRVSILPTIHGEKIVMRTLDKANLAPSLASLGLDPFAYDAMKYAIDQPHGIILVTGPTGSGKTTTLYSCLQDLNQPNVNIVTAEDPVEYELPGVNQVHVNQQVGLTFASVLRSVLRQDPDIVLVGEIRDGETADIAVKAALTGHLVLSTLHTNTAIGVIARLIDMGIQPFMLGSSLICAQAQRLYRRLCPICRQPCENIDAEVLRVNHIDPDFFDGSTIYEPGDVPNCPKCHGKGYKGRGAIMEVLPISEAIRSIIIRGGSSQELHAAATLEKMIMLKEAGLGKVRQGLTSLSAALEVTGGDD
ncbi:MAG: ATPase, T2SS/T4P/T4SS family [Kiritimatiellia bacterium]